MLDKIIFKHVLQQIMVHDTNYDVRYMLVLQALLYARKLGLQSGIDWADNNPKAVANKCRIVIYIQLPTGQISWHMPEFGVAYDDHTTEEKYDRIEQYVREY